MSLHSVRRRVIAAAALLLVAVAVASPVAMAAEAAAAIPAAPAPASPAEVSIDNFTFGPGALTVKAGTTVKWTNRDDIPHTIIDKQRKVFRSKVLDTDDSFSFTFNQPGTYEYFCGLHPHMTGRVVVTE